MATVTVCDQDGNAAVLRVTVESFTASTLTQFDSCSPECASARLAAYVVAPSPAEAPVEEPVQPEPEV